jgi:hypothetical protein
LFPPPYYCDFIDYSGGNFAYFSTIPNTADFDYFNMRHTAAEGYACTLLTAWIAVYPDAFVGTPDLVVKVWDDDGFGLPGTELASVTIPNGDLPTAMAYVGADFSSFNLVFEDGENYYVGITTTDQVNNAIAFLLDDGTAGTGRGGFYDNPSAQFYNRADIGFTDYNYGFGVDVCCADIPYSSCYRQEYDCGATYYFQQPSVYGTDYYNTRFSVNGPDTLTAVGVAIYAPGSAGVPDLDVFVWGSDAGFPDLSDVIYSTTIPYAGIQYFPTYNHVVMPGGGIVLPPASDFHVGWETVVNNSGDVLAGLQDDGTCGALRSSLYYGGWYLNIDVFGEDNNWLIYADICKDEFSECSRIATYCDPAYVWSMPSSGGTGRYGGFQRIEPIGLGCRLHDVRVAIDNPGWYGYDWGFLYSATIQIRDDAGGEPGAILASNTYAPGDLVEFPGFMEWDVLSLNILFDSPLWIGIVSNDPDPYDPTPDLMMISDDGTCDNTSATLYADDTYGDTSPYGFIVDAYTCCIPPPERDCALGQPDPNWPTTGHDFRRSSASYNSVGDAQCNQALSWMHTDVAGFIYSRPIIYDGVVLGAYNDKLQAFDITDGTLLWTKTGLANGIGSSFRNSVTVKDGYVYYGGGNAKGMTKADVYTGAIIWSRSAVSGSPLTGNTVYTTSVILDCGGTEVIIFGCDNGAVYALQTADGLNYGGWVPNPIMLDGDVIMTTSSNGSDVVYVGTDGLYGTGNGTLYAIDACTGVILWSLGEADLSGATLSGVANPGEIFQGPIGVDEDGALYVQTGINNDDNSTTPSGVVYRISSAGVISWAKGFRFPRYSGPVIDANNVYFTALRFWTSETNTTTSFKKSNGAKIWDADPFFDASNWVEGALSCEPLAPDKLYQTNRDWQLLVMNTDDGMVEFEYNWSGTSERGCGVAIDPTHVCFNNRQGDLYCLTNQADRPRLRILKFDELQPVPFFSPDPYMVTFDDVFMNNGCINLTGNLTVDENAPAAYAWTVNPGRIIRMQDVANGMVDNTFADLAENLVKGQKVTGSSLDADFATSPYAKDSYSSMAAYGPPAWLNAITVPNFDLAPGETFSVTYSVNGPLVTRGPHRAYVTINSNDDYYLNDPGVGPAVQLGVLGGCLQIDDYINFGVGEANQAPVFNTGELGNQNGSALWIFDGEDNRYWQGGLFFAAEGNDGHRLAWTTDSWHGGDPPDFWNSLLPDPNCFDLCEPYITPSPIILGSISHDGGLNYDDIYGYASVVAYIDSVVDFDCYGTGWDWANVDCPYDNALTLGLRVQEFMYGAVDEPALANVVIFRHDVTNRNAVPIANVGIGVFNDFDLDASANGYDLFRFDGNYSISWGAPSAAGYFDPGVVYGDGKIPMDVDPMLGATTIDANQAMWEANNVFLDSIYYYLSTVRGQTAQAGIDMTFPSTTESDDRDQWAGYVFRNFAASETYSFGTYMFGYASADVTDDAFWQNLAKTVNQFAGFNRGDINNDGMINLADVVALWNMVNAGGPGPLFQHLADVNATGGAPDNADVLYLANYYFCLGPAPVGDWVLPNICR